MSLHRNVTDGFVTGKFLKYGFFMKNDTKTAKRDDLPALTIKEFYAFLGKLMISRNCLALNS
jgi:hypothetical protein